MESAVDTAYIVVLFRIIIIFYSTILWDYVILNIRHTIIPPPPQRLLQDVVFNESVYF